MEENTVRLVGGPGKNAGFVELYFLGQWVQICGHSWDMLDASVVCHELGYLTAVTVYSYYSYNYRHYRGYTTYSYSCTGDESTLKQCSTSYEHRCDYNYDYDSAFVNCSGESIHKMQCLIINDTHVLHFIIRCTIHYH